jgi:neopullulanase
MKITKMKKIFSSILVSFLSIISFAQYATVYPTNWWVGMKKNKIQLLIKGEYEEFNQEKVQIKYPGVSIDKISKFSNGAYLAVDITIAPNTKPGTIDIEFLYEGKGHAIPFVLKPKRKGNGTAYAQGLTPADLIYLVMPDRFSNGDYSNDKIAGMLDQSLRRDTVFNRHGGDLKGIQNHLDYFKELGITSLWLNPVIENDMPERTEHGYAFTNHYKVDRRLGGEAAYQQLIDAAHQQGLKIIQDAVYNHVGNKHVLFQDMPDSSWFHWFPSYTNTTYKDQTLFDPYAAKQDLARMRDGWFTPLMPDWNHNNKNVENYLIQHAIWTVEEFGIDAWRIDTYAYNDLEFMNRCNAALLKEYPKLFMFGETWVHGVINQSFFVDNIYNQKYKSNLHGATDFQTLWGIKDVVTKDFGWTDGVNKLYTILAQDFVYKDATRNVVFLDNHDINRFFSECSEDVAKYKLALGWLLTTRGIPQLYYGNELATPGVTWPSDGYVRLDFMGGWKEDAQNKFTSAGRNEKENDVFNHVKTIANFRKTSKALTQGKLVQYVPEDAVYVYFRKTDKETVMVIMNTAKEKKDIPLNRFADDVNGKKKGINVLTKKEVSLQNTVAIEAMSLQIISL